MNCKINFYVPAAFCIFLMIGQSSAQEDLDIFLLIGQSNMAGRGYIDSTVEQDTAAIPNTWLFRDSADWVPARNPLNWYSTYRKEDDVQRIGPGYGFSLRMQGLLPDKKIGLVVQAKGGTRISQWERGDALYDNAVAKTLQAMQSGTLRAVLWHQGETDRDDTPDYLYKAAILIASLREDLGIDTLPFIAGQLFKADKHAAFNSKILGLPDTVPHTAVVLTDPSMISIGDSTHFNREAQIELGVRYADKVITMVSFAPTSLGPVLRPSFGASYPSLRLDQSAWPNVYIELKGRYYTPLGQLIGK